MNSDFANSVAIIRRKHERHKNYATTPGFVRVSKHRLDALTDGIFAIVMPRLVLELKVPDLPKHAANSEIGRALAGNLPVFFSFRITFMFAALFWYLHHSSNGTITEIKRDDYLQTYRLMAGYVVYVDQISGERTPEFAGPEITSPQIETIFPFSASNVVRARPRKVDARTWHEYDLRSN